MQDPRPLAVLFVVSMTGCAEPSWPPPVSPAAGGGAPAAPADDAAPAGASPDAPAKAKGKGKAKAATADAKATTTKAASTRLAADKVRLMVPGKIEIPAASGDAAGAQKKCMIRFEIDSTGKPAVAVPVECDDKYSSVIAGQAIGWSLEAVDGVTLPERSEVFWEIRYTLK